MILSDRIRPDVEAAPWVVDEVKKLEVERNEARAALRKARALLPQVGEQMTEFAYQELASVLCDPFEWEGDK